MLQTCVGALWCALLLASATAAAAQPPLAVPYGALVAPEAYRQNLVFLRDHVLPQGWQLSPVLKWDAYGHGASALAAAVTSLRLPASVATNAEAAAVVAAAAATAAHAAQPLKKPVIRRLVPEAGPAGFNTIVAAVQQQLGVEELLSPLNAQDIANAAAATRTRIPVHLYLYNHGASNYGYNFETPEQLQELVASLDPKLVEIRGFMMHTGGDPEPLARQLVQRFTRVVCPVARKLASKQPVLLHYAGSREVERMLQDGDGSRAQPPSHLCTGFGINWGARVGRLAYGAEAHSNGVLAGGLAPVLTWIAPITAIKVFKQPNGITRQVAVVRVHPGRYPATSWWPGIPAFESAESDAGSSIDKLQQQEQEQEQEGAGEEAQVVEEEEVAEGEEIGLAEEEEVPEAPELAGVVTASSAKKTTTKARVAALAPAQAAVAPRQPNAGVFIGSRTYKLAAIPTDGFSLLVDVTGSRGLSLGAPVCIVCRQRPLAVLAKEVGADVHNVALCLAGKPPAAGVKHEAPQCKMVTAAARLSGRRARIG